MQWNVLKLIFLRDYTIKNKVYVLAMKNNYKKTIFIHEKMQKT